MRPSLLPSLFTATKKTQQLRAAPVDERRPPGNFANYIMMDRQGPEPPGTQGNELIAGLPDPMRISRYSRPPASVTGRPSHRALLVWTRE